MRIGLADAMLAAREGPTPGQDLANDLSEMLARPVITDPEASAE